MPVGIRINRRDDDRDVTCITHKDVTGITDRDVTSVTEMSCICITVCCKQQSMIYTYVWGPKADSDKACDCWTPVVVWQWVWIYDRIGGSQLKLITWSHIKCSTVWPGYHGHGFHGAAHFVVLVTVPHGSAWTEANCYSTCIHHGQHLLQCVYLHCMVVFLFPSIVVNNIISNCTSSSGGHLCNCLHVHPTICIILHNDNVAHWCGAFSRLWSHLIRSWCSNEAVYNIIIGWGAPWQP